jgi:hypothetical protein
MSARVLRGTKKEIAESVARIPGEVREAIVFVDEPGPTNAAGAGPDADLFAEMLPFMVQAPDVDDSRDAIYT